MVAASSGPIATPGMTPSGRSAQVPEPPITASSVVTRLWVGAAVVRLAKTRFRSGKPSSAGWISASRSASTTATLLPESFSPNASSSALHQAFSGVTTAPSRAAPKKATGHSGRFLMTTATRSPATTPDAFSSAAKARVARAKASKVTRSSP